MLSMLVIEYNEYLKLHILYYFFSFMHLKVGRNYISICFIYDISENFIRNSLLMMLDLVLLQNTENYQ